MEASSGSSGLEEGETQDAFSSPGGRRLDKSNRIDLISGGGKEEVRKELHLCVAKSPSKADSPSS